MPGKSPSPDFRFEPGKRFELPIRFLPRKLLFRVISEHCLQRLTDRVTADVFLPKLPLDPAFSEAPEPCTARSPLLGKSFVVHVAEMNETGDHAFYHFFGELLLTQLCSDFGFTLGADR